MSEGSEGSESSSLRDNVVHDAEPTAPQIAGVIETTLCCPDLEAAEDFYTEVLGFKIFAKEEGRHIFFRCGEGMFLLFNPLYTSTKVSMVGDARMPFHGFEGAGHVAFRATAEEIDVWWKRLEDNGVEIESEIIWPEGGRSIFFRDPATNLLEFVTPETWGLD